MYEISGVDNKLVEENKKKYRDLYSGNSKIVVTAEWYPDFSVGQSQAHDSREDEYRTQIAGYNQKCQAVQAGFDNVPLAYFDFGSTSWLMALAYGCEMIKINGLINAVPLFYDAAKAVSVEKRENIFNYGLYPEIVDRILDFQDKWPEIPLTICDNQSPVDVVTQIIHSEEAMLGMYEEKDALYHLLDIVTDSIIEINRYLESIIKNFAGFQPKNYLPFGMHIADDDAAFLSPEFYREFNMPYTERLSEEFGGLAFHCCMGFGQNLENFAKTKGFIGFDAMPDFNPVDRILNAIDQKGVWNVYNYDYAKNSTRIQSDEEWFKKLIDRSEGRCGLLINAYGNDRNEALKLADIIKNYAIKKISFA
jgi:hypothetical protein